MTEPNVTDSDAMEALTSVCGDLVAGRYAAAESALDFGEMDEFLAKAVIEKAEGVEYDAATGRLTVTFVRTQDGPHRA